MPRSRSATLPPLIAAAWLVIACRSALAVAPPPSGLIPEPVRAAFDGGAFDLPARASGPRTQAAPQAVWNVPVIMVDFTDQPFQFRASTFDSALFDTTGANPDGSVFDYFRWVSGNRIRVTGRVVATIHLPQPKNWYAYDFWGVNLQSTPRNACGLVLDALNACDATVDWSPFDLDHDGYVDMLWVLHSGFAGENTIARDNLWSITSRLTHWNFGNVFVTNDNVPGTSQKIRINPFSIVPELSVFHPGERMEIGVFCHEFGHALGLPDLYDASVLGGAGSNLGPGNWSLMSTGLYGEDGNSPQSPAHLGAWPMLHLGWATATRPTRDSTFLLPPLASGGSIVDFTFQGEPRSEHFLIENRQRIGVDANLPGEGLIVYHVDEAIMSGRLASNRVNAGPTPGLRLVEADGRTDLMSSLSRGDGWDVFPGLRGITGIDDDTTPSTRTNADAPTNLLLEGIQDTGDYVRFVARVRARGWQPPVQASKGPIVPVLSNGPAQRAVLLDDGTAAVVGGESVAGRSQIVLRERAVDRRWSEPLTLSASPASAIEPTIAALPGNDLAVVWSDARHGGHELYYRSRVNGVWTGERRLTDLPGSSRGPAISADRRGGVHVAWHYAGPLGSQIQFLYFPYLTPYGTPRAVTDTTNLPDLPAVAAAPDGASYILWPEYQTGIAKVWFARFHPDSGINGSRRLGPASGLSEPSVDAVVDAFGNLHTIWTANSALSEVRYQMRAATGMPPMPRDTVLEARAEPIQNVGVAVDRMGGIHLIMEAASGGRPQIRYKHREPDRNWDAGSTEVTLPGEGDAVRPAVLPEEPRMVSVLHIAYAAGSARLVERRRHLTPGEVTSVPPSPAAPIAARGLVAAPNPVRAGASFVVRPNGTTEPGARIEVFDVTGRRVGACPLVQTAAGAVGRFDAAVTRRWASGVYVARRSDGRGSARFVVVR